MERKEIDTKNIMQNIISSVGTLAIILCIFFVSPIKVLAATTQNNDTSMNSYVLTIEERGGVKEVIKGSDIQLKVTTDTTGKTVYSFNEKLLQSSVNKLSCLDASKIVAPKNAILTFQNNSYGIINAVYGNKVYASVLYDSIFKAIQKGDTSINLESANCYENPRFSENSQQVINARDTANRYMSSKITYSYGGLTQTLDGSTIKDWISLDSNFQIVLYEDKVKSYVEDIAYNYTSSLGTSIKVSGGYDGNNHSWMVDSAQETQALISNIKNGDNIEKSPIYAQTDAASYFSNVGENFIEVDLTKQHVWCYKNGFIAVEGDIVTGNESNGNATPDGAYSIYAKQKDTVLVGEDYASPVSFWMPFNKNIGLHDANWRSEFGGEIYKTNGSHGCVNLPYAVASAIYDNSYVGEAVICHY